MTDIVERLRHHAKDDHVRGCQGREYYCRCGYDEKTGPALFEAAAEIERLLEFETLVKHYQDRLRTIANHADTPELIRQYAVGLLDSNGMPAPDFKVKP